MTEISDVIVVGAGFAGLYAVHRLASSGLSVTAVEAAPDVGGTWYWNRYPGARCDVESVDYSYSFDEELQQSWRWTERFAAQPEILAYLRHVADRLDLRRHYRFGVDVTGATFDEGLVVFQRSANYTIPMPNRPWSVEEQRQIQEQYPERRRASAYAAAGTPHGTYHKNAVDTEPAERAEALWKRWREGGVLFAKTFPDQTSDLSANDIARTFAEQRIREIVNDPVVATDLIPVDHPIGTKRICTDDGYYATFNRANVRLVNLRREPIEAITADGVRTSATTYPCDVLVFATGFDAMTGALTRIDPKGAGGQRLRDIWADGPVTFLGLMVPGLPNLFTISGPGSPSVLANMVLHAEVQVDWVVDLVRAARHLGVSEVEPRHDAALAWTEHVAQAAERTLFPRAASSWYLGANIEGKKRVFMPYTGGFGTYRRHCDEVARSDYAGLVLTTR